MHVVEIMHIKRFRSNGQQGKFCSKKQFEVHVESHRRG